MWYRSKLTSSSLRTLQHLLAKLITVDRPLIESPEIRYRTPVGLFRISVVDTPILLALEVAAPLVECAANMEILIPACAMSDWSQCPIVDAFTGACGLRTDRKRHDISVNAVVWSLSHTILRFRLDKASHPLDKKDRVPPLVELIFLSWYNKLNSLSQV